MFIFNKIFRRSDHKSAPLSSDNLSEIFASMPSLAGPAITPSSAMRVPAVYSAITLIGGALKTLPAKLYERTASGKQVATKHPANRLVHNIANDWTTAGELRGQLTRDALLHGNGFAFANRVDGRVREFIRLDPQSLVLKHDETTGEPFYVSTGAPVARYTYRDILHIVPPGGISPITAGREAIGLALVLEQHASRLFGRGARPSGILKFDKALGEEAVRRISSGWAIAHSGEASGRTAILEDGGSFQPLTFNSVDTQFEQIRRFQTEELARLFRVPPHLLFEMGRATWGNAEEMGRQFLQLTLLPWLQEFEAAYSRCLLAPEERDTFAIEFIPDDLLRADTATRANAYQVFRSAGIMTANEIRKLENLPAIDGGDTLENPYITPIDKAEA